MQDKKSRYKLLYVEDEDDVRKNYSEYLSRYFNTIYEAADAKQALKIYKEEEPNILIIDINLPQISGLEFLKTIRESDHTTKAIMLTANSDVETLLKATELKLTKYLVKPVSRSELKDALFLAVDEIENYTTKANKIIKMKGTYYWDQENKKLLHQNEEYILTSKEIKLLTLLFSNLNKTFSVQDIIFELWYDSDTPKEDALKTLIKGLRKKLPQGSIKNIFGVGYKVEV